MRSAVLLLTLLMMGTASGAVLATEVAAPLVASQQSEAPKLEILAQLEDRPGNVAVSTTGRIFLTMHPFGAPKYKLVELMPNGRTVPFPTKEWSSARTGGDPGIENALGIRAVLRDAVMTLDMGGTHDGKTYPPRLLGVSLRNDTILINSIIPPSLLTEQSFLQDFVGDWIDNVTYVADMGQADLTKPAKPAILVLYSNPFQTPRRVLDSHPSLMPTEKPMQAEGRDVTVLKDGKPVQVHAGLNPITIDPQRNWLYYAPMGAGKIYRVPISMVRDIQLPPEQLAAAVQEVADKPESDGMTIDAVGNIYLTGVNSNEIGVIRGDGTHWGKYETYLKDDRLVWPDGLCFGPDGLIYVTVNQLNRAKQLNGGKETGSPPYFVARFKPLAMGTIGR